MPAHTNQLQKTMSMIAINAQTESAILKMLSSNAEEIIQTLAEKFEFDADEARRVCELPIRVTKPKSVPRKAKSDEEKPKKSKDKKPKEKKTKEKSDKPKKAKTGYLVFSDAMRSEVRTRLQEELDESGDEGKLMAKDVVKALAQEWKELSEEEREEWKEKAAELSSSSGTGSSDDEDE